MWTVIMNCLLRYGREFATSPCWSGVRWIHWRASLTKHTLFIHQSYSPFSKTQSIAPTHNTCAEIIVASGQNRTQWCTKFSQKIYKQQWVVIVKLTVYSIQSHIIDSASLSKSRVKNVLQFKNDWQMVSISYNVSLWRTIKKFQQNATSHERGWQ